MASIQAQPRVVAAIVQDEAASIEAQPIEAGSIVNALRLIQEVRGRLPLDIMQY